MIDLPYSRSRMFCPHCGALNDVLRIAYEADFQYNDYKEDYSIEKCINCKGAASISLHYILRTLTPIGSKKPIKQEIQWLA